MWPSTRYNPILYANSAVLKSAHTDNTFTCITDTNDAKYNKQPATCYKGIRKRTRLCHADSADCTPLTNNDETACNADVKCSHINMITEGSTQTERISPTENGGLPDCGKLTKKTAKILLYVFPSGKNSSRFFCFLN